MGIGSHIHVEVVAEEVTFPVGIPAPVAVRLGIMPFAAAGTASILPAFAQKFFALLCCSADRSTIAGESQMLWVNQPYFQGL